MVKSMTGFGKAEATVRNKKITVELRSLNSKQLDLNLRLPAVYRQADTKSATGSPATCCAARSTHSSPSSRKRCKPLRTSTARCSANTCGR